VIYIKKFSVEFTFRNFVKDLGFRILMAAAGIGLFALLAFAGDYLDIGLLQSSGGILLVLLIGGPIIFIPALILLYATGNA
jgi:hypothetical protein